MHNGLAEAHSRPTLLSAKGVACETSSKVIEMHTANTHIMQTEMMSERRSTILSLFSLHLFSSTGCKKNLCLIALFLDCLIRNTNAFIHYIKYV